MGRNADPLNRGYYGWYLPTFGNITVVRAPESLTGPDGIMLKTMAEAARLAKPGRLGFLFDIDPVQTEVAACNAIVQEYGPVIDTGWLLAEEAILAHIDEFNQKLYSNGLQRILDEAQKQLDEWEANK